MKRILLMLVALIVTMGVKAQEPRMPKYKFSDNWSLSLGAGITGQWGDDVTAGYRWNPQVNLGVNKYWNPVIGTRLNAEWGKSQLMDEFNVHRAGIYLDVLFKPLNLFNDNFNRTVDFALIGGVGYVHAFEKDLRNTNYLYRNSYPGGDWIAPRVGVQVTCRVSEEFQIYAEGTFTALNDDYDNIVNKAHYDGMMNLSVGFIFNYLNHDGTRNFSYVPSYNQSDIDALNNEINSLRAELDKKPTEVKVVEEVIVRDTVTLGTAVTSTVQFRLNESTILNEQKANLANTVKYLLDNKEVKVVVTGYADAQTGTPEYNLQLSCKRAEAVKSYLMNEGVHPNRIEIACEGDKIQKYNENSWNRAAVIEFK